MLLSHFDFGVFSFFAVKHNPKWDKLLDFTFKHKNTWFMSLKYIMFN